MARPSFWTISLALGATLILFACDLYEDAGVPETEVVSDPRIRFTDVTRDARVERSTQTYDAVAGDFDGDGRVDLYVGNHAAGAVLLRNRGDGSFEDVLARTGIEASGDQHGAAAGDYDNDGDLDLIVSLGAGRGTTEKSNRLYRNDGALRFADIGNEGGVADPRGRSRSAAWLDVDRDGRLDLVVANYATPVRLFLNQGDGRFRDASEEYGVDGEAVLLAWSDVDRDGDPDLLLAGPRLRLLRNEEGKRFVDATDEAGLGGVGGSVNSMAFADLDGDGIPDLLIGRGAEFEDGVVQAGDEVRFAFFAGDTPRGLDFTLEGDLDFALFHNGSPLDPASVTCGGSRLGAGAPGRCAAVAAARDASPEIDAPGFMLWRDVDEKRACADCAPRALWHLRWKGEGDHHLSGILRRAADPLAVDLRGPAPRGAALWRGRGDGTFEPLDSTGLTETTNTQAVAVGDVDDDGALDVYVVDSGRDGAGARGLLHRNLGDGHFVALAADAGASPDSGDGRGAAAHFIDFDGDGRLDLFLLNGWGAPPFDRGPYRLLQNRSQAGHWIDVELRGTRSNRQGLGAWVEVEACGKTQRRYHDGARGPYSQSALPLHFGVGACLRVNRVSVEWPSGNRQTLRDLEVDRAHRIAEVS